jgi:hypothetical protein
MKDVGIENEPHQARGSTSFRACLSACPGRHPSRDLASSSLPAQKQRQGLGGRGDHGAPKPQPKKEEFLAQRYAKVRKGKGGEDGDPLVWGASPAVAAQNLDSGGQPVFGFLSSTLAYLRVPLRDAFLSFWLRPCCSVST